MAPISQEYHRAQMRNQCLLILFCSAAKQDCFFSFFLLIAKDRGGEPMARGPKSAREIIRTGTRCILNSKQWPQSGSEKDHSHNFFLRGTGMRTCDGRQFRSRIYPKISDDKR